MPNFQATYFLTSNQITTLHCVVSIMLTVLSVRLLGKGLHIYKARCYKHHFLQSSEMRNFFQIKPYYTT